MRGAASFIGRRRRWLELSTALSTGLLLGAPAARAQSISLPTASDLVSAKTVAPMLHTETDADITQSFSADAVGIGLKDLNTVIRWKSFDIPTGKSIGFTDARSGLVTGTTPLSVLNRVIGDGTTLTKTTIAGALNAASNISVYLVNSSGILFRSGSAVNVGGLIASTQGLTNADFADNILHFSGTGAGITVEAGATLRSNGDRTLGALLGGQRSDLILIGSSVSVGGDTATLTAQTGATPAATDGDVGIIAANDVTITSGPGSPLAVTIAKGTAVTGAFKVNGTISGRNVTLALATRDAVADTLLSIDGVVTATGATATQNGVVLSAGRAVTDAVTLASTVATDIDAAGSATVGAAITSGYAITAATAGALTTQGALSTNNGGVMLSASTATVSGAVTSGRAVAITTGGAANVTGALVGAGNVTVTAGGAAAMAGAVTAGGDYAVRGTSITIGKAGTSVLQKATDKVELTATTGGIAVLDAPTIQSNSGNLAYSGTNRGLFLDAVNGTINLSGSALLAGSYPVQIRNNAADATKIAAVTLGSVTARGITVANAAHDASLATTASFTGDLTTGALTLGAADFTIAGTGNIASLRTTTGVTQVVTTGTGDLTIGAITLDGNLGTFSAAGTLSLTGITESGLSTGGVTLSGTSIAATGAITVRGLTATTTGAATFSGAIEANAGPAAITAGGALGLAGLNAGHAATLDAASITNSGATRALNLSATATGNIAFSGGIITNSGAATISAGGTLNLAAMLVSTATLSGTDIAASAALTVHDLSATASGSATFSASIGGSGGVTLAATSGTLSVNGIAVGGAVALNGATVSGTGSIQGDTVSATAAGNLTVSSVSSTGGSASLTATAGSLTADSVAAQTTVTVTAGGATGDVTIRGIEAKGGNATVTAGRQASVIGTVGNINVKGDYFVRGEAVTIGGLQNISGAATITAVRSITSGGPMGQLYSDRDGTGNAPLTLRITGTDPAITPVLNLRTGPLLGLHAGTSAVRIELPSSDVPLLFGTVSGTRLQSQIGATGTWEDGLTSTSTGGIRASSFILTEGPLLLNVPNGKLTVGTLEASNVSLDVRELFATDLTATAGSVLITGRGGDLSIYSTITATGATSDIVVDSSGGGEALIASDLHAGRDVLIGQTHAFSSSLVSNEFSGDTSSAGRDFRVASAGDATITTAVTAGRDAVLTAGGDANVSGAVAVTGGDYRVSGRSVTLGGGVTQQASGEVTIEATDGAITGGAGLTLRSDTSGAGLRAVRLITSGTTGGDIALAGTTLSGGPGRQSDVVVQSRVAENRVILGDVSAARLRGGSAGGPLDEGLIRIAAIDIGNVDIQGDLILTASGNMLTAGTLSGQSVTLSSDAASSAAAITATNGAVMIGASGAFSVAGAVAASGGGGDIRIDRAGALSLGSLVAQHDIAIGQSMAATGITLAATATADGAIAIAGSDAGSYAGLVQGGGAVSISGRSLSFGTGVTAVTGTLSLTATNGNLTVPTVSAGGNATLVATAGLASVTGPVSLPGDYSVTGALVTLGTGSAVVQEARGAITIAATGGTLTGRAGLTLHADTDGSGNQALTLATSGGTGGTIALADTSLVAGNAASGAPVRIRSRQSTSSLTLGDITAGSLLGAVGGNSFATGLTRTTAITVGSVTLGNALPGTDSTLRLVSVGGALTTGLLSGPGAVILSSAGLARVAGISAGSIEIAGSGALTSTGALISTGGITINRGGAVTLASLSAQTDVAIGQATSALNVAATGRVTSAAGRISIRSSNGQVYGAALSARDAVRLEGGSVQAPGITSAAGAIDITTGGATTITTLASAGSSTITAGGLATVTGAVDVGGAYRVTGATVLLGNGSTPVLQRAGSVIVEAKGGSIFGASGLTLRGEGTLVLNGEGGIAFDPASRLEGGDIGVHTGDGQAIALGIVSARRLTGANANHALTATLAATGALTLGGDVTTALTLDASSAGPFTTRRVTVTGADQDLVLAAGGPSGDLTTLGALIATRNVTLAAAGNASFTAVTATQGGAGVSAGGSLTGTSLTAGTVAAATAGGALAMTSISGQTGASAQGGSVVLGSASSATGLLSLTATAGDLITPVATSGGAVALAASGDIAVDTASAGSDLTISAATNVRGVAAGSAATLTAGGDIAVTASGEVRLADATAANTIAITGGSLVLPQVSAANGSVTLVASSGAATIGTLEAGADASITADLGLAGIASLGAGGNAAIRAESIALSFARIAGEASLTSLGGAIRVEDLIAGSASIIAQTDAELGRIETTAGPLAAVALGHLSATTLIARGDALVSGATLDITQAGSMASLVLTTTTGLLRVGRAEGATGVSIQSAGDAYLGTAVASGSGADLSVTAAALRGLTPSARAILSAGRDLTVTTTGATLLGPITAGGTAQLSVAAIDVSTLDAAQAIVVATAGNLRADRITTTGAASLSAISGLATLTSVDAGGNLVLDAGILDAKSAMAAGTLFAQSRGGALRLGTFEAGGDITIVAATDATFSQGRSIAGGVDIAAGGALSAPSLTAATLLRTSGAASTIGDATADLVDMTARSGAFQLDTGTAVTSLTLTKRGTTGALLITDALLVTGASGDAAIASDTTITLPSLTAGRDASLTASGAITAPALAAGGTLGVNAGSTADLVRLTGNSVSVTAGSLATVAGAVTAGSYTVEGASVALGSTGTAVSQAATGSVAVRATSGAITGRAGLALTSDADGDGAGDLILRAAGGIAFAAGTSVTAGPLGTAAARIAPGSGATLALDRLTARSLVSYDPALTATGFAHDGTVTIARMTLRDPASISLTGAGSSLTLGTATSESTLALATEGTLTATSLTSAGLLTTNAASATIGTASAGAFSATTTGGVLDLTTVTTQGSATLAAATDLRLTTIDALGAITATAGRTIGGGASPATWRSRSGAIDAATLESGDAGGAISLDSLRAATGISVAGRRVVIGSAVSDAGAITLAARQRGGAASTVSLAATTVDSGGSVTLSSGIGSGAPVSATNGAIRLGTATSRDGALTVTTLDGGLSGFASAGPVLAAQGAGGDILITSGREAVIGSAVATRDLLVRSGDADVAGRSGRIAIGRMSVGRTLSLLAYAAGGPSGITAGDASVGDATIRASGAPSRIVLSALQADGATSIASSGDLILASPIATGGSLALDAARLLDVADVSAGAGLNLTAGTARLAVARAVGDLTVTAGTIAAGDLASSGGAIGLTATTGPIMLAKGTAVTDLMVATPAAATIGTVRAGRTMTLSAGSLTLTDGVAGAAGVTTSGAASLVRLATTSGVLTVISGGALSLGTIAAATNLDLTSTGSLDATLLTSGGDTEARGANVTAATVRAGGALTLEATAGDLLLRDGTAGLASRLTATGGLHVISLRSAGDVRASGRSLNLETIAASGRLDATAGAGGASVGMIDAAGDVTLTSASGLTIDTIASTNGALLLAADGGDLALNEGRAGTTARLSAGGTLGATRLAAAGDVVLTGNRLALTNVTAGGTLAATAGAGGARFGRTESIGDTAISAVGGLTIDTLASNGALTLTTSGGDLLLKDGRAGTTTRIAASGIARVVRLQSAGDVVAEGGMLDIETLASGGALSLAAGSGGGTLGTVRSTGDATVSSAGGLAIGSIESVSGALMVAARGDLLLTDGLAGTGARIAASGTAHVVGLRAGGDIGIGGETLVVDTISGGGTLEALAGTGGATLGAVTAGGDAAVTSAGGLSIDTIAGGQALSLAVNGGDLLVRSGAAGGRVGITAAGAARVVDLRADGNVTVVAARLDLERLASSGALEATAGSGGAVLGRIEAADDVAITSGAALTIGTLKSTNGALALTVDGGDLSLADGSAGRAATVAVSGVARIAWLQAGGDVLARSGTLDIGALAGRGMVTLSAGLGGGTLGTIASRGDATIASDAGLRIDSIASTEGALALTARGALLLTEAKAATTTRIDATGLAHVIGLQAGGDIVANAGGLQLDSISGGGRFVATAGGGGAALGMITMVGDAAVTSAAGLAIDTIASTTGSLGLAATGGDLRLNSGTAATATRIAASGTAHVARLQSAGDVIVEGGSLELETVTTGGTLAATAGRGGATLGVITSIGDAAVTSAAGLTIGTIASRDGGLSLAAMGGDLALRDGQAGGSAWLSAAGTVRVTRLRAIGDAVFSGAALDLADLGVGGALDATAGLGGARLGTITAGGDVAAGSEAGLAIGALTSATGTVTLRASGLLTAETLDSALALSVDARDLTLGTIRARNTARLSASNIVRAASLGAVGDVTAIGATLNLASVVTTGGFNAAAGAGGGQSGVITTGADVTATSDAGLAIGTLTSTNGAMTLRAGGLLAADALNSARTLTVNARELTLGTVRAADTARLSAGGTARATDLRGAGDLVVLGTTLDLAAVVANGALDATAGAGGGRLGTATAGGDVDANSSAALTIGTLTSTNGAVALSAGGLLAADVLDSAMALTISAPELALGTIRAGMFVATQGAPPAIRTAALDPAPSSSAAGAVRIDSLFARGDVSFAAGGDLGIGTLTSSAGAIRLGSGARLTAATITSGRELTITAASAAIGSAVAGGALIAATSAGDLGLGSLVAPSATLSASGTASVSGAATVARDYAIRAGAITLGGTGGGAVLQSAGGGVTLVAGSGAITGNAGLTLSSGTGGISLAATGGNGAIAFAPATAVNGGGAAGITTETAGTATFGAVSSPGRAIVMTAGDLALGGAVTASSITLVNRTPANVTRLGDAPADAASEFGGGEKRFDLSTAEMGRLSASNLVIDAKSGAVRIGDLALAPTAGSASFQIRTSGRIDALGRFTAIGAPLARMIVLGGSADDDDRASVLRVASTAGGGGRLLVDGATLDLRADAIGAGLDGGFLDMIGIKSGTPAAASDVTSRFVSQPNSSLYNATLGNAAGLYSDPVTLKAGRLIVRYANFAVFQNTGTPGTETGMVIGGDGFTQSLQLRAASQGNAFAMFGTINGIGSTATSLLSGSMLVVGNQVSRGASRANGCLIGSAGGGCLSASIVQPTLSVFDSSRADVFRTGDDLTLPFDPLVGTSNEALFSDIASAAVFSEAPAVALPPASGQ